MHLLCSLPHWLPTGIAFGPGPVDRPDCFVRCEISMGKVLLALLFASALSAQSRQWYMSAGIQAAGSTADAVSSWRYGEGNELLCSREGTFGGRGVAIKGALSGALLGVQWVILRKFHSRRLDKAFSVINVTLGGALGAVAAHNYAVRWREEAKEAKD